MIELRLNMETKENRKIQNATDLKIARFHVCTHTIHIQTHLQKPPGSINNHVQNKSNGSNYQSQILRLTATDCNHIVTQKLLPVQNQCSSQINTVFTSSQLSKEKQV